MFMNYRLVILIFLLININLAAQQIVLLDSNAGISFRGLSVVNDNIIWVSGSKGTIKSSIDGGLTWLNVSPKGYEKSDFRDIEAFGVNNAIVMSSGAPSYILKTTDGGASWKEVYKDERPEVFLDAMDFWDDKKGVIIGDPIDNIFVHLQTNDGGETWQIPDTMFLPFALDSEAVFAASGTGLRCFSKNEFALVTGGKHSRLLFSGQREISIPIKHGKQSEGAFSFAFVNGKGINKNLICVVGGDYLNDSTEMNSAWYRSKSKLWYRQKFISDPNGYRSCVEAVNKNYLISCGTSGVDILYLKGVYKEWQNISKIGFHVVRKAKKGNAVFLAGSHGKIAMLKF